MIKAELVRDKLVQEGQEELAGRHVVEVNQVISSTKQPFPDLVPQIKTQLANQPIFQDEEIDDGDIQALVDGFRKGNYILYFPSYKGKPGRYRLCHDNYGETIVSAKRSSHRDWQIYQIWKNLETFNIKDRRKATVELEKLLSLCQDHEKELRLGAGTKIHSQVTPDNLDQQAQTWPYAYLYEEVRKALELFPEKVMGNPEFAGIWLFTQRIGGQGIRLSSFSDRKICIFKSLLDLPINRFMMMFLHEIGDGIFKGLKTGYFSRRAFDVLSTLRKHHTALAKHNTFLGYDVSFGEQERINHQLSFKEYVSDLFLFYFSQGNRLREFIAGLPNNPRFPTHARLELFNAWQEIYKTYRDYVCDGQEFVEYGEEYVGYR